jgi:catalase (peroxidase I)
MPFSGNEANPWPGTCTANEYKIGDPLGKGMNTFTSGFEGSWTSSPTTWDNNYFVGLVNHAWSVHVGPGEPC